jgi:hypothetical protein
VVQTDDLIVGALIMRHLCVVSAVAEHKLAGNIVWTESREGGTHGKISHAT